MPLPCDKFFFPLWTTHPKVSIMYPSDEKEKTEAIS